MNKEGALSNLRVIELGNFVSAAFCTKLLADLGAEVIKVEQLGGDESRRHGPFLNDVPNPESSALFLYLNTNKLGITLDVRQRTGRDVFLRLVENADVLVENNPPRSMQDLEIDYAVLSKLKSSLIVTSITPFGKTGPYRDYKAYDINCSAMGGLSFSIGYPDRQPLKLPLYQADLQAGLAGAVSTLVAILHRDRSGEGQHIDLSETDLLSTLHMGNHVLNFVYKGISGLRRGYRGDLGQYPFVFLPCKDGYVCIYTPEMSQWLRLIEVMGSPEWSKNPRYHNKRAMLEEYPDEVDELLKEWLKERTKEEIFRICQENRVPIAPVKDIKEVVEDLHLKKRGFFAEIDHPISGKLKYPGAPYKLSETPVQIKRRAPLLGEHNQHVYCGLLGYTKEDLVDLRRVGII
jgi:crotonobetainyl-CoA:carnitine CoA-transferase CaiB-like acyl-CoA transferase